MQVTQAGALGLLTWLVNMKTNACPQLRWCLSSDSSQPMPYCSLLYYLSISSHSYSLSLCSPWLLTFFLLSDLIRDHSSNKPLQTCGGETAFQNLSVCSDCVLGRTRHWLLPSVGSKLTATSLLFLTTCWVNSDPRLYCTLLLHVK